MPTTRGVAAGILAAAGLATALLAPLSAQDGMQLLATGRIEAVVVRGERALALTRRRPAPSDFELFGLPSDRAPFVAAEQQQRLITSENRAHLGRVTVSPDGQRSRYERLSNGTPAWQVEVPGIVDFYLDNDGQLVVAADPQSHAPAMARFHVIGAGGRILAMVSCPFLRTVSLAAGRVLAVGTARNLQIYRVTDTGVERVAELPAAVRFELSPDGDYVASAAQDAVQVYRRGALYATFETAGFATDLAFDAAARLLAIADPLQVQLVQLESRRRTATMPAGDRGAFRSVDIDQAGRGLIVGQLRVEQVRRADVGGRARASVTVLEVDGRIRQQEVVVTADWGASSPAVQFFAQGRRALAILPEAVYQVLVREAR